MSKVTEGNTLRRSTFQVESLLAEENAVLRRGSPEHNIASIYVPTLCDKMIEYQR